MGPRTAVLWGVGTLRVGIKFYYSKLITAVNGDHPFFCCCCFRTVFVCIFFHSWTLSYGRLASCWSLQPTHWRTNVVQRCGAAARTQKGFPAASCNHHESCVCVVLQDGTNDYPCGEMGRAIWILVTTHRRQRMMIHSTTGTNGAVPCRCVCF